MPTGYTAGIVDGKITEFNDFALQCARAFGALIELRDEPFDAPIPDEIKAHTSYYEQSLEEARQRLASLLALTPDEVVSGAASALLIAQTSHQDSLVRVRAENARLKAMLAKVERWTPPTPDHQEMKRFMVDQLTISMTNEKYYLVGPNEADFVPAKWHLASLDAAAQSVTRAADELAKERRRNADRNGWLQALRASLKTTEPA